MAAPEPAVVIRPAEPRDTSAICAIGREVVTDGATYALDASATDDDLRALLLPAAGHSYVAELEGQILGCYMLKPNQPGRGSHVANAGYAVASNAQGRGIGEAMGRHSLDEARRLGFAAMQFNLVVSTNEPAVRLWQKLGFAIVGRLPGAFDHARLGRVDAFVMHRLL